ncbi:EpsG family protein [Bacteroides ihuae]|uniref:EpsG family protein n=1 Tax=Bacteroides ihuae TaxID=1852362 RepID=UPI0008D993B6|nr:EpsG family protein [Bacteroides ihuae]
MIKKTHQLGFIIPLALIVLVNPTIALFVSLIILVKDKENSKFSYLQFFFMLALWMGCINMTKVATSDTIYYLSWFESIDISQPIHSILYYKNSEYSIQDPFFNILSVFFYYIALGNTNGYILLCTIIIYFFHYLAIYSIAKTTSASKTEIIAIVIALTFYNPFFIQSIHGLRQTIASAFMIYAISQRVCGNNKKFIIYGLLSVFTHSSTLVYIVLALIPQLYKRAKIKTLFIIFTCFAVFVIFNQSIALALASLDIEMLSGAGTRLSDTYNNPSSLTLSMRGFNLYCIPLMFCAILNFIHRDRLGGGIFFQYAFVLTYATIVAFQFAPVFSVRYFFFVGSFFPFILIYFFNPGTIKSRRFCVSIAAFLFLFFFFYLGLGRDYAPIFDILIKPFMLFF